MVSNIFEVPRVTENIFTRSLRKLSSIMSQCVALGSLCLPFAMQERAVAFNLFPSYPKTTGEILRDNGIFRIYVRNHCALPIQIAINKFIPGDNGGGTGSNAGIHVMTPDRWVPDGWWRIPAGATQFIADQRLNSNLYYYAETISPNPLIFSGSESFGSLQGKRLGFKRISMGPQFGSFTLNIVCR
jgi:hypothetical protein